MLKQLWPAAKLFLILGASSGAIVGLIVGGNLFGIRGALMAILPGAILGAVVGLDMLLVPPPAAGSRIKQGAGPLFKTALALLIGLAALAGGLYTWNHLTFTCQRLEAGQVDCQRAVYTWLGQVKDNEQAFSQVQRATQVNSTQVTLVTAMSEHEFLEGFGPDTADRINRFLDSHQPSLQLESRSLWFFSPILLGISLVALALTIPASRAAAKDLDKWLKTVDA